MSQEKLEIVKRGLESYLATGEVPWALFDEKVEVHDHDTPEQRIETTRQDAQLYRLRQGIVVETDYYNDREQALKAVGPGE